MTTEERIAYLLQSAEEAELWANVAEARGDTIAAIAWHYRSDQKWKLAIATEQALKVRRIN